MDSEGRIYTVGVAVGIFVTVIIVAATGALWRCGIPVVTANPKRVKAICEKRVEYFQERLDTANFLLEKRGGKEKGK